MNTPAIAMANSTHTFTASHCTPFRLVQPRKPPGPISLDYALVGGTVARSQRVLHASSAYLRGACYGLDHHLATTGRDKVSSMRVIGMISGTSFDGIDVAIADLSFDGDAVLLRPVSDFTYPYAADVADSIAAALPPHQITAGDICVLDTELGKAFAAAAFEAQEHAPAAELVVSHGQTIFHWVDGRTARGTLQLGQPAWIAAATGLPVVSDMRAADIAHGGQGAPLAALLDVMLLGSLPERRAALNLGGIANVTITGGGVVPLAFDTGPANALLDAAVHEMTDRRETFDRDGRHAARGSVDEKLLAALLDEPYYSVDPPKSTGKEIFHLDYLRSRLGQRPIDDDVLATVVALTAETVADACRRFSVTEVIASGGGVRNPELMAGLQSRLGPARLTTIDEWGLPADAKEAYLFALLGFLTVHGLPGSIPSCTGANQASILGSVTHGGRGFPAVTKPQRTPSRLVITK